MHWSSAYIGLTWQEVGEELCWGLVRKVFRERAGIDVPSYIGRHGGASDDQATIAALLRDEPGHWPWLSVAPGEERELDVAVFKRAGIESHVGIVVGPGRMLHLARDYDARIERFDEGRWRVRLSNCYRHSALTACSTLGYRSNSTLPSGELAH